MPVKGILTAGDRVRITFAADPSNAESSALVTGYEPDGSNPVPKPLFDMVAPGAAANQHTTVVPAFTLKIAFDLPESGGADLEVFVNGQRKDRGRVTKDDIWTYGIV